MDPFDTSRRADDDLLTRSSQFAHSLSKQHQVLMDKIIPHLAARWIFSGCVLLLFLMRVVISEGWYVICYALGIYYLNLLIDFLSPKIDPDFQATRKDLDLDSGPALPTRVNDEFKPFIRRLPEYKFWYSGTKATLISLFLSMFSVFDMPVFWPILLVYFIVLTFLTLRKQIKHMYRHHYVPWTTGKQRYGQAG